MPDGSLQVHLDAGQTLVDPDGRKGGLGIFLQVPVLVRTVDQEVHYLPDYGTGTVRSSLMKCT